ERDSRKRTSSIALDARTTVLGSQPRIGWTTTFIAENISDLKRPLQHRCTQRCFRFAGLRRAAARVAARAFPVAARARPVAVSKMFEFDRPGRAAPLHHSQTMGNTAVHH